jgi:hypothetical protein
MVRSASCVKLHVGASDPAPQGDLASRVNGPEMEQLMNLVGGAALYELPMSRSGRMRQLPL